MFWRQFLCCAVSAAKCKAHIIVVGSHADLIPSQSRKSTLLRCFKESPPLHVVDYVMLDCRMPSSSGMSELRRLLKRSCRIIQLQSQFDYQIGGYLNRFINEYLLGVPALSFKELLSRVQCCPESEYVLLQSPDVLHQACESMNTSGHILLLKDVDLPEDNWIILKKELIISQVHGLLKHLKQSTQLGFVPLSLLESQLRQHAPDLPPDLAISYMKKMIFCSETDPHTLSKIENFVPRATEKDEVYYFFPSLINIERPSQVWEWTPDSPSIHTSGWHLRCTDPDQFFTPRVLQVLQIELVCHALAERKGTPPNSMHGCKLWKNGVRWLDSLGIEVIYEVDKDSKSLILLLKCTNDCKLQYANLRATLISRCLAITGRMCKETKLLEYLIHPHCLHSFPIEDPVLLPISQTAPAVIEGRKILLDDDRAKEAPGYPFLSIDKLLDYEPYQGMGFELVHELVSKKDSKERVPRHILDKLADVLDERWKEFAVTLHFTPRAIADIAKDSSKSEIEKCCEMFRRWSINGGMYGSLYHDLGQYSIFRGRNPLVSLINMSACY